MTQQPEISKEIAHLISARDEYVQKTIPTILAGLLASKGIHSSPTENVRIALDNVRALWDIQNPEDAKAIKDFEDRKDEEARVVKSEADQVSYLADREALLAAIAVAKTVPNFSQKATSDDEKFVESRVKSIINGDAIGRAGPVKYLMLELHASAPLGESTKSSVCAKLLAEGFMDALCGMPFNPDPNFQSRLSAKEDPVTYLRNCADQLFGRYAEALCSLPAVTALASVSHFVSIADHPEALVLSAQYFGARTLIKDRSAKDYPLDVLRTSLLSAGPVQAKELLARLPAQGAPGAEDKATHSPGMA